MAFSFSTFGKASGSGNSKSSDFFTYKSNDAFEDLKTAGYFNKARGQLKIGDVIYIYSIVDDMSYLTIINAIEPDVTLK